MGYGNPSSSNYRGDSISKRGQSYFSPVRIQDGSSGVSSPYGNSRVFGASNPQSPYPKVASPGNQGSSYLPQQSYAYGKGSGYSQKNFNELSYPKTTQAQTSDYRSPSSTVGKYQESSPFKANNGNLTSPGVYGLLMKKRAAQGDLGNQSSYLGASNDYSNRPMSSYGQNNYGNVSSPKYSPGYYNKIADGSSNSYPYTNPVNTAQNPSRTFGVDSKNPRYYNNFGYDANSSGVNPNSSGYSSPINSGYKAHHNYNNFGSGANSPAMFKRRADQENSYQSPIGFNRTLGTNDFSQA